MVSIARATFFACFVLALDGVAAGESPLHIEREAICRRVSYLMNEAPAGELFVLGHVLEEKPAAWAEQSLYLNERATSFDVAPVQLFGRSLNAVTWVSDGTCKSTSVTLWSEDYRTQFSRWSDLQPDEAFGLGEWLLKDGPYVMVSDSGEKHFRIFQITEDGDAKPVCEGRKLSFVHERAGPDASDPVCESLNSPEAVSPRVEPLDAPLALDEAIQFGVNRYHLSVRSRARADLDNDGRVEWVGLARYFIDTAACGDPTDVMWPLVLDDDGERALDTETNQALIRATGVKRYGITMQATLRLIDFKGARYVEQRSLPGSLAPLHQVLRLDGSQVSTVCDFHPRLQYEVLPISEGSAKAIN